MMTTVSFNNTETRLTIEDIITFIDNMQKSEQSDKERNESEQSKETDKLAHMFSKEILDIISEYKENIKVCDPITYIDEMNVSLFSSVLACITNNFSVGKLNHNDLVKEFINIISQFYIYLLVWLLFSVIYIPYQLTKIIFFIYEFFQG